jgi:hypothetical protein
MFHTTGSAGGTGIGNFGRLKAQKIKSLVARSAYLKRGSSNRTSANRFDEPSFSDSDQEESYFERRKPVSDSERRAKQISSSRNERARGAHSLNSVLSQYRGEDSDSTGSEATSGSKGWGNIADVTYGRQNRKKREPLDFPQRKGPLDSGFFSRRSFKEIGCSDEIIGALRNFDFPRPSHIQVNTCQKYMLRFVSFVVRKNILNCFSTCIHVRMPTRAFINCLINYFRLWPMVLSWRGGVVSLLIKVGLARHWHIFAL